MSGFVFTKSIGPYRAGDAAYLLGEKPSGPGRRQFLDPERFAVFEKSGVIAARKAPSGSKPDPEPIEPPDLEPEPTRAVPPEGSHPDPSNVSEPDKEPADG